jgi:hypothetical protein
MECGTLPPSARILYRLTLPGGVSAVNNCNGLAPEK